VEFVDWRNRWSRWRLSAHALSLDPPIGFGEAAAGRAAALSVADGSRRLCCARVEAGVRGGVLSAR